MDVLFSLTMLLQYPACYTNMDKYLLVVVVGTKRNYQPVYVTEGGPILLSSGIPA